MNRRPMYGFHENSPTAVAYIVGSTAQPLAKCKRGRAPWINNDKIIVEL